VQRRLKITDLNAVPLRSSDEEIRAACVKLSGHSNCALRLIPPPLSCCFSTHFRRESEELPPEQFESLRQTRHFRPPPTIAGPRQARSPGRALDRASMAQERRRRSGGHLPSRHAERPERLPRLVRGALLSKRVRECGELLCRPHFLPCVYSAVMLRLSICACVNFQCGFAANPSIERLMLRRIFFNQF